MTTRYDTFETPVGPFSVAIDDRGDVISTAFGERALLQTRLKTLHPVRDREALSQVGLQVAEYFAGRRQSFALTCTLRGTLFQEKVWSLLRTIPYGETRSYGELARAHGLGGAARALGAANGANPICLFIPCHRVIGADGTLTGYAFGTAIKRWLLALERDNLPPAEGAIFQLSSTSASQG